MYRCWGGAVLSIAGQNRLTRSIMIGKMISLFNNPFEAAIIYVAKHHSDLLVYIGIWFPLSDHVKVILDHIYSVLCRMTMRCHIDQGMMELDHIQFPSLLHRFWYLVSLYDELRYFKNRHVLTVEIEQPIKSSFHYFFTLEKLKYVYIIAVLDYLDAIFREKITLGWIIKKIMVLL